MNECRPAEVWLVWGVRLIVGAVFVVSGIAKLIDLWGTVFKIEDYLSVWGVDVPRTLVMVGGMALASFEFTAGLLLAVGCYRRVVTWALAACMFFMLPLTLYIWIADPVSDCGCFGDFIIISNSATFFKNVVLSAMIVYLVLKNRCASSLFKAPIQWIVVVVMVFYCVTVSLIGYNIQPMVDFRPFRVGKPLLEEEPVGVDEVMFRYSKDGEVREFASDELPDEDDGWEFVGRVGGGAAESGALEVFDPDSDEDVTYDYLGAADSLLLLVIPEPARADLSYTYSINELADAVTADGGSVVALLATDGRGIERWRDHSMASYACLKADDTQLKQLSRGVMSMVWVRNDTIRWKRTVASISLDDVEAVVDGRKSVDDLVFRGDRYMMRITLLLCGALLVLFVFQAAVVKFMHRGGNKRVKDVAQVENVH